MICEYAETGLPGYLQRDLDAFKEGVRTRSSLRDCLWGELYGSINGAVRQFYRTYLEARLEMLFPESVKSVVRDDL